MRSWNDGTVRTLGAAQLLKTSRSREEISQRLANRARRPLPSQRTCAPAEASPLRGHRTRKPADRRCRRVTLAPAAAAEDRGFEPLRAFTQPAFQPRQRQFRPVHQSLFRWNCSDFHHCPSRPIRAHHGPTETKTETKTDEPPRTRSHRQAMVSNTRIVAQAS